MEKPQLPVYFDNNFTKVYGNFGSRFAALLLDGLILAPLTIGVLIINNLDIYNVYYTFPISTLITLIYYVILSEKYGATPGKRLMGLTILKSDGDKINYKDAFLRYLPNLVISVLSISATFVAIQFANPETYNTSKWLEKSKYLMELNPRMYYSQIALSNIFVLSNLVIFLVNPRSRSISDLSGDTVVVYDKDLNLVEDFKNSPNLNSQNF